MVPHEEAWRPSQGSGLGIHGQELNSLLEESRDKLLVGNKEASEFVGV